MTSPLKAFISCLLIVALSTPVTAADATLESAYGNNQGFKPTPHDESVSEELQALMEEAEIVAARTTTKKKRTKKSASKKSPRSSSDSDSAPKNRVLSADKGIAKARSLAAEGKYPEAARLLFQLSRSTQFTGDPIQVRYLLGLMLYEMKLYQTSAFVFYDVVKQESRGSSKGRFLRPALEKLSIAADALDSDVLLRYAIKKVKEDEFPAASRDMLYYRTGELKLQDKEYAEAARVFARVKPDSDFFPKAKYKQALALTEAGDLEKAQNSFEELAEYSTSNGVTDPNRVSGLLGRARVLYQRQNWDAAIEAYRDIPRDTPQWHEALFESTWAMLRSARFRSALSNFHSLHSDYYEDVYQPESLLLRAIVYLFICRYDEMEKVLTLFEKIYKPVATDVRSLLNNRIDPLTLFKELSKTATNFDAIRMRKQSRGGYQIPFLVARKILKEGDVSRNMSYIRKLEREKKLINAAGDGWANSALGRYAKQVVEKRLEATQVFTGRLAKKHLEAVGRELVDLFEQAGFLRFEVIRGKKEAIKKEIVGKGINRTKVDEDSSRSYFIQNGYEYWPFKGEYWLDEIGNYHFVGVQACE
jgi:tetratricopeptide (TPR) repeat protein